MTIGAKTTGTAAEAATASATGILDRSLHSAAKVSLLKMKGVRL